MNKLIFVLKTGAGLTRLTNKPLKESFEVGTFGSSSFIFVPTSDNPELMLSVSEVSAIILEDQNQIAIPQPGLVNGNGANLRINK